jgi:nucleotide-binding universal stress UspA family protein
VGLAFALSLSQAAATLAATTVGAEIGLLGDDVVNAVVVVIVISLFASSLIAARTAARIVPPGRETRTLGRVLLAAMADAEVATRLVPVVARIARADGGHVVPVHVLADGDEQRSVDAARSTAVAIDGIVRRLGVETEPSLRVAASIRQGIRNEITEADVSLLVLGRHRRLRAQDVLFGGTSEEIVAVSPVPVVVIEMNDAPVTRVLLPLRARDLAPERLPDVLLALEVARLLEASGLDLVVAAPDPASLPPEVVLTADAERVALPRSRTAWVAATARPGDLVILPGGGSGIVFGIDAARIAAMPGVSAAVVVGPYRSAAVVGSAEVGAGLLVAGKSV